MRIGLGREAKIVTYLTHPHSFRNILPLLCGQDNPAILRVDGEGVVEIAHVLRYQLQRFPKRTPCTTRDGMRVTDCMDIWPGFVYL